MENNFRQKPIWNLLLLSVLFAAPILLFAQTAKSPRILMCNERESISDERSMSRHSEIIDQKPGVAWQYFIGDTNGLFLFSIRGNYPFVVSVFEKKGSHDSRDPWTANVSLPLHAKPVSGMMSLPNGTLVPNNYYFWDFLTVDQVGMFSSPGRNFHVAAWPTEGSGARSLSLRASWHTTKCGTGSGTSGGGTTNPTVTPGSSCRWHDELILYSTQRACVCRCNGNIASDVSKCGSRPRNCP